MGRSKIVKAIQKPFGLLYRADDARECYRVWNSKWFGDQFESLTENEMEVLQKTCIRFGIPLEEAGDE